MSHVCTALMRLAACGPGRCRSVSLFKRATSRPWRELPGINIINGRKLNHNRGRLEPWDEIQVVDSHAVASAASSNPVRWFYLVPLLQGPGRNFTSH